MVYKYKNNKWSRMIAARKLAAAARAQETTESATPAAKAEETAAAVLGKAMAIKEADAATQSNPIEEAEHPTLKPDATAAPAAVSALNRADKRPDEEAAPAALGTSAHDESSKSHQEKEAQQQAQQQPDGMVAPEKVQCAHCSEDEEGQQGHPPNAPATAEALVPPTQRDLPPACVGEDEAGLPHIIRACYVPSPVTSKVPSTENATASTCIAYVMQFAASPANVTSIVNKGTATACRACGVQLGGSCLQLVRWNSTASALDNSNNTNSGVEAVNDIFSGSVPSEKEVMMYVDADGRCFMLAPSSVVDVRVMRTTKVGDREPVGGAAPSLSASEAASTAARCKDDTSTTAYWLIPSCIQEHFCALLWAQQHWREVLRSERETRSDQRPSQTVLQNTGQMVADAHTSLVSFAVELHPSRWIGAEPPVATTPVTVEAAFEHAGKPTNKDCGTKTSPALPASAEALNTAATRAGGSKKKSKKKAQKAQKRPRSATPSPQPAPPPLPPPPAPEGASLQGTTSATVAATCRIPYVVSVRHLTGVEEALTTASADATSLALASLSELPLSAVFCVGNSLRPFPDNHNL